MVNLEDLVSSKSSQANSRLKRSLSILRYYSWPQIVRRISKVARNRLFGSRAIGPITHRDGEWCETQDPKFWKSTLQFFADRKNSSPFNDGHDSNRTSLCENGFVTLLGETRRVGLPNQWQTYFSKNQTSHLWRFQLHYHEFLFPLAASIVETESDDSFERDRLWAIIEDWIDTYPSEKVTVTNDAWHPYCISRRVLVWCVLLNGCYPSPKLSEKIVASLISQVQYLGNNLETDLGGNHLFENLTAIAIAGSCIKGEAGDEWLHSVTKWIGRELPRQVLEHGEHFELSPMYHCQVLAQLFRISMIAKNRSPKLGQLCLAYAERMYKFIKQIQHPDGEIPLFGDSGFGEAPSICEIDWLAMQVGISCEKKQESFRQMGPYFIFRSIGKQKSPSNAINDSSADDFLICDFGEIAARQLPAHGHCDLLNIEASINGQRWIVDSGNFNYEDDSMRRYCRSSLAHNVVTVENLDQCDVWSKFRMGFRGHVISMEGETKDDWSFASARHNAYRGQGIPLVERMVAVNKSRAWICADVALGNTGNFPRVHGYLHFYPGLAVNRIEKTDDGCIFELSLNGCRRRLTLFGSTEARQVQGWYCESFGSRQASPVIEYWHEAYDQKPMGWLMEPLDGNSRLDLAHRSIHVNRINKHHKSFSWNFGK